MKNITKLLVLIFTVAFIFSLVGCGRNSDEKLSEEYQQIIEDFADGDDMEETLTVGEEHRAWGSVHLNNGPAPFYTVYSSDENVVTVSSKGKVTAIGEGVAYVIIAHRLPILGIVDYNCSKYTVYADKEQLQIDTGRLPNFEAVVGSFSPDAFNCHTLVKGETHTPSEAMWLTGNMGGTYSSDEAVVTVSENGTVTAVGTGTAYVVIAASGTIYKVLEYTVTE